MRYKISAYRAVDDQALNKKFIEGHAQVLKDYGVTMITSNKPNWLDNDHVYCVVAYDEAGEMVGGVRLHIADWIHPLPLENALSELDPNIHKLVESFKEEGVGELCGLWNAKKVAGVGISLVLMRASIAIIDQLNFKIGMGICAEYSLPLFQQVGFEVDTSLKNNGEFPYPTDKYITRVIGILNAGELGRAQEYDREQILLLRNSPQITKTEEGKKGSFTVDYDLIVK